MNEITLFDFVNREVHTVPLTGDAGKPIGGVRWSDPSTSREAAAQVDVKAIRAAILAEFRRFGWLTDDELADNLPDRVRESVKTARSGLKRDGFLEDSGTKRPSNHGRRSTVWKLTNQQENQ